MATYDAYTGGGGGWSVPPPDSEAAKQAAVDEFNNRYSGLVSDAPNIPDRIWSDYNDILAKAMQVKNALLFTGPVGTVLNSVITVSAEMADFANKKDQYIDLANKIGDKNAYQSVFVSVQQSLQNVENIIKWGVIGYIALKTIPVLLRLIDDGKK